MNILFIGDIFGKPGRQIITNFLPKLISEFNIDICIANGENVAQGRGITQKTAEPLFEAGIDVFTSGNHLWDKKESLEFIKYEERILKPLNYPDKAPGNKYYLCRTSDGKTLCVLTLCAQAFMPPANSPFQIFDEYLPILRKETNNIFIDFHGEATAEKRAMGFFVDGKVSALIGTHTHIQTADEEILPNGTAYITDVGMTGPHDSVIGVDKKIILEKMTSGVPKRYEVSKQGLQINAVVIKVDEKTGKALEITRLKRNIHE